MIKKDGYRKIKFAIVQEVEIDENMSDNEIQEYLESKADNKEFIWCDADEEIFE
jgi:hypothetical protein